MADISQIVLPDGNTYNIKDANATDTKVTQTESTTNSDYEVLLSGTADDTTRTEGANKCKRITANPSKGTLTTFYSSGRVGLNGGSNTNVAKLSLYSDDVTTTKSMVSISSGNVTNSQGGSIDLYTANSAPAVSISGDTNGNGAIYVKHEGAPRIDEYVDGTTGSAVIKMYDSSTTNRIILDADAGKIKEYNASGNSCVDVRSGTSVCGVYVNDPTSSTEKHNALLTAHSGGGSLTLKDSSTTTTISLFGSNGVITATSIDSGLPSSDITIASGDKLVVTDSSDSDKVRRASLAFGTSTSTFLRNDGQFATPSYPTVNNATLTIQKNGTSVATFTANASSNVTANITVPTQTSQLTNNSIKGWTSLGNYYNLSANGTWAVTNISSFTDLLFYVSAYDARARKVIIVPKSLFVSSGVFFDFALSQRSYFALTRNSDTQLKIADGGFNDSYMRLYGYGR